MFGIDPIDGVADHGDILSVVQMIKHEDGTWSAAGHDGTHVVVRRRA